VNEYKACRAHFQADNVKEALGRSVGAGGPDRAASGIGAKGVPFRTCGVKSRHRQGETMKLTVKRWVTGWM